MKTLLLLATTLFFSVGVSANQNTEIKFHSITRDKCVSVHPYSWGPSYYGKVLLSSIFDGKSLVFNNNMIVYTSAKQNMEGFQKGQSMINIIPPRFFLVKIADMKAPNMAGIITKYELFRITADKKRFYSCRKKLWNYTRFHDIFGFEE